MGHAIDEHWLASVRALTPPATRRELPEDVSPDLLLRCFEAQLQARHLDFAGRWLQAQGAGYYTIGSAGHESNAAVALSLEPTDPALLHYRSGGFYAARAGQVPGSSPVDDVLRSLTTSVHDPISGGRHKVFGNHALSIIPQTSTIASQLPRAFGIGFTLGLGGPATHWPEDAIVVCSFGDASANHSTAAGTLNAAAWCAHRGVPLPLLLVCEDNGIGISTRTPGGWIEESLSSRPSVRYLRADGDQPVEALSAARELSDWVRRERRPAVLHLKTVRFMGHAGSDAEMAYRTRTEITADHARDPLLATARALVEHGLCTVDELLEDYESVRGHVLERAESVASEPRLRTSDEVRAPLTRQRPGHIDAAATRIAHGSADDPRLPATGEPVTLAQAINAVLVETMAAVPETAVFGEDVAVKGGGYGVTRGLRKKFGGKRVLDTLLDEQTIIGTALGMSVSGWMPVPEIQYLAYVHNALDQLRGEGATQAFFSNGQFENPMVVRVAGLAYQKGFGGHFHNDNSVAALRDIPGLVLATPSDADDAITLLRECVALAQGEGRVCVFLEPIALYHEKDLHEPGDGLALGRYAPHPGRLPTLMRARRHGTGSDLLLVSFGNGVRMSRRVATRLAESGIEASVLDLRWLTPLPLSDLVAAAGEARAVLVVDETRASGGVSESILTALVDAGVDTPVRRVTSDDTFIPLGPAANTVLLDEEQIQHAAEQLFMTTRAATGGQP
ncbi:MAG: thiamine pyrophosphate-dependent enzyme [Nocardioides sp.]|nr:thiamine pyrophosphate-dependent enzyme [Nocardioides sp.]